MTDKNTAKKHNNSEANPLWGGRFESGPDALMEAINASISFDQILYKQDIFGSKSHCKMLVKQNILTEKEGKDIIDGLEQIEGEIDSGRFEFKASLEDIHMNIESRLKEIIGETAGKLHTARSRNDQVATDFKLWVRDQIDHIIQDIEALQKALLNKAKEHCNVIMPGFTHLQTAQPVTLGHHLHAYIEMLERDKGRMSDARKRLNQCPLGSAALAGTSFPIDRHHTSELLGFDSPTANSLDSVSDRDFAIEFLSAIALCAMHLSRFAEELVIWSGADFNFVSMSGSFTSGSSIMPQKRNPDAAELVRAKTGRINGSLITLLTVMKGLPLAYSKDMQEDKEPVFDAASSITICLKSMTGMVSDLSVNADKMKEAAGRGFSTATDLADWLVKTLHMPFRNAHHVTGAIVKMAEDKQCDLHELSIEDMKKIEPSITEAVFEVLSVEKSVHSRNSYGGTSPDTILEQLNRVEKDYNLSS
ncbi:MAG: argininosuccinate lyase [Rickettsiales bacterium]|nr:argininosuccinate lyase [Rickettsiales bacterium]